MTGMQSGMNYTKNSDTENSASLENVALELFHLTEESRASGAK